MVCVGCKKAKETYKALAALMPKEEIMELGVCCRICWSVWFAEVDDEDGLS